MVWALEVYRILAYRRMAELQAEAEWARTVAHARPWRPADDAHPLAGRDVHRHIRAKRERRLPARCVPIADAR